MNLGREKLCELASLPQVVGYVRRADCKFYQSLVSVLIPVILRPVPCEYFSLRLLKLVIGSRRSSVLSFINRFSDSRHQELCKILDRMDGGGRERHAGEGHRGQGGWSFAFVASEEFVVPGRTCTNDSFVSGRSGQGTCTDLEEVHLAQPLGPGCPRRTSEPLAGGADARGHQQDRFRERSGSSTSELFAPFDSDSHESSRLPAGRNKRPGCANATQKSSVVWNRISRRSSSSRHPWSSGPYGWMTLSPRPSNPTQGRVKPS